MIRCPLMLVLVALLAAPAAAQNVESLFLLDVFDSRATTARLNARIAELTREMNAQQALGNMGAVAALGSAIAQVQAIAMAGGPVPPGPAAEVHVVAVYEPNGGPGGSVTVNVTRPGTPIDLYLSSYESANWTINAAPGALIQSIRIEGYDPQTLVSAPPGIPVTNLFQGNGGTYIGYPGSLEDRISITEAVATNFFRIATTVIGSYTGSATPIEVGGGDQDWREQYAISEAVRYSALLVTATSAGIASQIGSLAFLPILPPSFFSFGAPNSVAIAGPLGIQANLLGLPSGLFAYAVSPTINVYVLNSSGPQLFNVGTSALTPLPALPPALPAISNPSGITYDYNLSRLLVATYGGVGYLYAFDEGGQSWSVVNTFSNRDSKALVYHLADGNLYSVERGTFGFGPLQLVRLDSSGNVTQTFTLGLDTWDDFIGRYQAYSVGPYVAVVGPARATLGIQLRHCFLVDPANGDIVSASVFFN